MKSFGIVLLSTALLVAGSAEATASAKFFDRVLLVPFENTNYQDAIKQPFFSKLAREGVHFTNFAAETHPSQGNYIALTSGSLNGVRSDGRYDLDVNHIADLLDAKGVSWKVYAEDYPGGCFKGMSSKQYVRKHNPFISYVNIQNDATRCANIVNADEFDRDAAAGRLPQYIFYVPNEKNDGHDTGVSYADKWYQKRFSKYFSDSSFMQGMLVISTFDENAGAPGNKIYTSFFGPTVKASTQAADSVNHYSVLRLIEENWNLGSLGKQDATAPAIPNVWQ